MCDPAPSVSVVVAWKSGNNSRLVREFVELSRRCCRDLQTPTSDQPRRQSLGRPRGPSLDCGGIRMSSNTDN